MTDRIMTAGDTSPTLEVELLPAPINLTGAAVTFSARDALTGAVVIDGAAAVIGGDPTQGIVSYAWQAGDLAAPRRLECEFRVVYSDGAIETFPAGRKLVVEVVAGIG